MKKLILFRNKYMNKFLFVALGFMVALLSSCSDSLEPAAYAARAGGAIPPMV